MSSGRTCSVALEAFASEIVAVVSGLALSEIAVVTFHAVQTIVDPLGDSEELLISVDHEPTDVDVRIEHVADEHQEHLGHAAACGSRVDVPDGLASKLFASHRHGAFKFLKAIVPDKGLEPRQRVAGHLDLEQRGCQKGPVMGRHGNDPPSPVPPPPGTGERCCEWTFASGRCRLGDTSLELASRSPPNTRREGPANT